MFKILCIIPAYNEEKHIANIVSNSLKRLPVLVIDDGSNDNTTLAAQKAGALVITNKVNKGKGVALLTGFKWAIQNDYQVVITLDGDGQHNPDEIPRFLDAFSASNETANLIIGTRQFERMPMRRRIPNSLAYHLFSWTVGQKIADNQSGYRLVSHKLMTEMLNSRENGFEFELEMIVKAVQMERHSILEIPISTIYANETSHIKPIKHLYHFMKFVCLSIHN